MGGGDEGPTICGRGGQTRDKGPRGSRGSWAWSLDGRQVRAKFKQLRWQCFKEELEMPILGFRWHRAGCAVSWNSVQESMFRPERGSLDIRHFSENTRQSHSFCFCRAGGCIEEPNLRQVAWASQIAQYLGSWTEGNPWRGVLTQNVLPWGMHSRGCEHARQRCTAPHRSETVQDGVTLQLAKWLKDGWIGMHCDFILGHEASGIASYLDPWGPSQDPSA